MSDDRFAIVPVSGPSAPPDAIVVGPMSEVMEYLPQSHSRLDAEAKIARAEERAMEAEQSLVSIAKTINDALLHLSHRMDAYEVRKLERERQAAADAEREEAERIERILSSLPDPDNPDVETALGDDLIPAPSAASGLQPLPALSSGPSDDSAADQGALPPPLDEPSNTGNFTVSDPADLKNPELNKNQVPQPVSVSLW